MSERLAQCLPSVSIPHSRGSIPGCGHHSQSLGAKVRSKDGDGMFEEFSESLPSASIQYPRVSRPGYRDQPLPIRTELCPLAPATKVGRLSQQLPGLRIPDPQSPIV